VGGLVWGECRKRLRKLTGVSGCSATRTMDWSRYSIEMYVMGVYLFVLLVNMIERHCAFNIVHS
jgi:hypothetical protein